MCYVACHSLSREVGMKAAPACRLSGSASMEMRVRPAASIHFAQFVRRRVVGAVVFLIAATVGSAVAGEIRGHVTSRDGKSAVIGATIIIVGTKRGANGDKFGSYVITDVGAGSYMLEARSIGFAPSRKSMTLAATTDSVTIDFTLAQKDVNMADIVVEARANRETESSARSSEKNADNVINVITAEAIDRSTDLTSADALQRVSGISLVRDQGEGRYVIVRGLEQRYNNTLVNGMKIPSPESKDRFVPLDVFPSQLLQRLEVTKALTADQEGDAIGGTTNLVLRDAPDQTLITATMATGESSYLFNHSYSNFDHAAVNDLDPDRIAGAVSDQEPTHLNGSRAFVTQNDFTRGNLRFTDHHTLPDGSGSLVVGDRFLDNKLGLIVAGTYQNTFNGSEELTYTLGSSINDYGIPYLETQQDRHYSTQKTRGGVSAKADYIFDVGQEVNCSLLYVGQQIDETRHSLQINVDGTRGSADLNYLDRSAMRTQNIMNLQLEGDHHVLPQLELKWAGNYSDAVQDRPDEAEISILQNYDVNGQLQPFQGLQHITRVWRKNDDKQLMAKLDAYYNPDFAPGLNIQAGGLLRRLSRVNFENDYTLMPVIVNGQTQAWNGIDSAQLTPVGNAGNPAFGYQNYTASEVVTAGYVQARDQFGALQILAGLRFESTLDNYFTLAPETIGSNTAAISYLDLLPSIHFRYALTAEQILRLSLTQSLSRPSYFDLVPAKDVSDAGTNNGNPYLKPAHATNVDARYEWYPTVDEQLTAGAYFKTIDGAIEQTFDASNGASFTTQKINAGTATIFGVEFVAAKQLGDFSIVANYTYAFSSITTLKLNPQLDSARNPIIPVPTFMQTRPLQAQSNHVANLEVRYHNDAWGTSAALAGNLTGRRLEDVSAFDGFDAYQRSLFDLDFSGEQKLFAKCTLFLKVVNLLNTPTVLEVPTGEFEHHPTLVIRQDYNRIRGSVGITYSF